MFSNRLSPCSSSHVGASDTRALSNQMRVPELMALLAKERSGVYRGSLSRALVKYRQGELSSGVVGSEVGLGDSGGMVRSTMV